jgi:anti-sigma-K factor RskA
VSAAVVVDANGRGTLTVSGLPAAPSGKTYEVWVIPAGGAPQRAGLFRGGQRSVVHLARPVPAGAVVAATVERAGGTNAPTTPPVLTAQA